MMLLSTFTWKIKAQNGFKNCGSTHYSMKYSPKKIDSLHLVPISIQESVNNHLKDKLGIKFFDKLIFDYGEVINYSELVRLDPQVLNYKWKIPKYDLSFYIKEKNYGINYCCSRIVLDSLGNVIRDIEFPSFKRNNLNANFVPIDTIFSVVNKMGYSTKNHELGFSKNHIVYIFSNTIGSKVSYIEISAHTSAIIKKYKLSGIRDY